MNQRAFFVEAGEVGRVSQQHAHLDHVIEGGAACMQDGSAVLKCLPGLVLDGRSRERVRTRVDPNEAGDEEAAPGADTWP